MVTVTKASLAQKLEEDAGLPGVVALKMVDAFFAEIITALERDGEVKISNLGNFSLRRKKSRPGRNPKTGEEKLISERTVVTFHASQRLQESVAKLINKKKATKT